jgi:hypothetical protein
MRKFILGLLLGGLLLSGGWFAWGAIQSEVGNNVSNISTGTWTKQLATSKNLTDTATTLRWDATTVVPMTNAGLWAMTGTGICTTGVTCFTPLTAMIPNEVQATTRSLMISPQISNPAWTPSGGGVFDAGGTSWGILQTMGNLFASHGHASAVGIYQGNNGSPAASQEIVRVSAPGADAVPRNEALSSGTQELNSTPTWDGVHHSFTQSTTGITTNAVGTAVNMTTTPMSKYTMIIDRTAGATDAVVINLECSYDSTIWPGTTQSLINVTTLVVEPTRNISTTAGPCNYMRYNVVTVGAGNTLTIQLLATR